MNKTSSGNAKTTVRGAVVVLGILGVLMSLLVLASLNPWYWETKGPFKNWMQVVDWERDGDLDVIVSHTRWEEVDISWAGVGIWVNRGDGTFDLLRDRGTGTWPFLGFAAAAGDVDRDGDLDLFTQDFGIYLHLNEGGAPALEPAEYRKSGGINSPPAYNQGHQDMGGTIALGDLNGDGWPDGFVAGCCYGMNPREPVSDLAHGPSVSWVWINESGVKNIQTGYILPLDFLNGRPIRQAALGDVDGDGDLDIFAAVGKPTMGTVDSPYDLLLLNDGAGNLAALDQKLGDTDSTSVALGDVNGDGHLDALVGTSDGARLLINQGDEMEGGRQIFVPAEQSFDAVQTAKDKLGAGLSAVANAWLGLYLPYGSVRTQSVFLADLDGDGNLDALLARLWRAEIWWNTGLGKFHRSDVRFAYREDTGVAIADFDGDGNQDIFIGRNEDDYQVWFNDGRGGFRADNR